MQKIFFPSSRPRFVDVEGVVKGLKRIASRLAKKNRNIEAVYLFGSYAKGDAGIHSDADILIVLSQDNRRMIDRLDEFILAFCDGPAPVDVLVYTRGEIESGLKEGNRFITSSMSGIRLV